MNEPEKYLLNQVKDLGAMAGSLMQGSPARSIATMDFPSGNGGLDLTKCALGYKINPDGDNADVVRIYAGEIDKIAIAQTDLHPMIDGYYVYVRRTISNDTMSVLMASSVPANDATYLYYRLYQFAVTDGVASLTKIYRPFDIESGVSKIAVSGGVTVSPTQGIGTVTLTVTGFTGTVTVITSMQYASNALQYKTKVLTYANGLLTSVGTESGWNTLFTAATGCP